MSGRVVHFEIPYDDADRARSFYSRVFEWEMEEMPDMGYTMVASGPTGPQGAKEPGFINGGMMDRSGPAKHPLVVVDVDDIDATLATIGELGGSTVTPKTAVGDMGSMAYATDCEGNVLGLWQMAVS